MTVCNLCPNKCGVDRSVNLGKCLSGDTAIVNRVALHYLEEPPISGQYGSGTVFFGGCVMRCAFCQNAVISRKPVGKRYTPEELAEAYKFLEEEGAHNINLVTPTQWSTQIKKSLEIYRPQLPIVYNTSGYELPEVVESLKDYVDVFLPDFKYSDSALAKRLSGRENYPDIALEAIRKMVELKPPIYEDDLIKQGVIIRHLVLPGYVKNSLGVLDLIAENIGTDVTLSLMSQFTPMPGCKDPSRPLKPIEYKAVIAHAVKLGFEDVYVQESSSVGKEFIPPFDLDED